MPTPIVAVFGSSRSVPGTPQWDEATTCGRLLAEAGFGVATGGYGGSMEAVSAGAAAVGGVPIIGVTAPAVFPARSGANRFVADEQSADQLAQRIGMLIEGSDASIALPGSIGTFAELMLAWNYAYVAPFSKHHAKPVVAVGSVWRNAVAAVSEHLDEGDGLVICVDDVGDAVSIVGNRLRTLQAAGEPPD